MRKLMIGECDQGSVFQLVDPTQFLEIDFEAEVVKALTCLMPEYRCGVFAGAFVLEGERHIADLALVHRSLSHWFIVEVELAGHSFENHVLPQVRCFRYGVPESSCVTSLLRAISGLTEVQAVGLLNYVPHYAAVVSNLPDPTWTASLSALDAQHLTVSVYRDRNGRSAHEIDGRLTYRIESLGFAQYSAIDNCIRMPKAWGLPPGTVQIIDQFGNRGDWTVREEAGAMWVSKSRGLALIPHNEYVQVIRTFDGDLSIRLSIS